jgi:hypothetical protein
MAEARAVAVTAAVPASRKDRRLKLMAIEEVAIRGIVEPGLPRFVLDVRSPLPTRCDQAGEPMLTNRAARLAAVAIAVLAVASAFFRVSTAPERIAKRRAAEAQICTSSGGRMTKVGVEDVCVKK